MFLASLKHCTFLSLQQNPTYQIKTVGSFMSTTSLSTIHSHLVSAVIALAWKLSTAGKHSQAVQQFLTYCAIRCIPEDNIPSSEALLCKLCIILCRKTSRRHSLFKCNGIWAWHIQNNIPYQKDIHLIYIIKEIENQCPSSSIKNQ